MTTQPKAPHDLCLGMAAAWSRVEKHLDAAVSNIKGISFAEYRLLRTIADSPGASASRVDVARAVGLSASGVTRALQPLEKLGFVTTHRSDRDARLALATLTPQGAELVGDATGVIDDAAEQLLERAPRVADRLDDLTLLLADLAAI